MQLRRREIRNLSLSPDEYEELCMRVAGYLETRKTTKNNLMQGMGFILDSILSKRAEKDAKAFSERINFNDSKHVHLRKYGLKILELKAEGMGSRKIHAYLQLNHNAKISRSLIERFLRWNNG